jgi:hypothetical protein
MTASLPADAVTELSRSLTHTRARSDSVKRTPAQMRAEKEIHHRVVALDHRPPELCSVGLVVIEPLLNAEGNLEHIPDELSYARVVGSVGIGEGGHRPVEEIDECVAAADDLLSQPLLVQARQVAMGRSVGAELDSPRCPEADLVD